MSTEHKVGWRELGPVSEDGLNNVREADFALMTDAVVWRDELGQRLFLGDAFLVTLGVRRPRHFPGALPVEKPAICSISFTRSCPAWPGVSPGPSCIPLV